MKYTINAAISTKNLTSDTLTTLYPESKNGIVITGFKIAIKRAIPRT
ncbi:MAG: hypothetical protein RBR50_07535 [Candidatus Izemoplasmatales bacterium]|nr:hypothetical protein [Candidatus Izemoplasmatales bacterium]